MTRYADVLEVFNRPEIFSSDRFRKVDPGYASQRPEVRAVAEVLGDWLSLSAEEVCALRESGVLLAEDA